MRASVDLPDPDSPTTASAAPRGISNEASTTAATGGFPARWYVFDSPVTDSIGSTAEGAGWGSITLSPPA